MSFFTRGLLKLRTSNKFNIYYLFKSVKCLPYDISCRVLIEAVILRRFREIMLNNLYDAMSVSVVYYGAYTGCPSQAE